MGKDQTENSKFLVAKERVTAVKKYYTGLVRLAIFIILLLLCRKPILQMFIDKGLDDSNILYLVNWNVYFLILVFVIIFLIKGVILFVVRKKYLKEWEERQIEKIMKEDNFQD